MFIRESPVAMLSAVLNATPQPIFWKDRDGRYLGCNRAFARLAGLADPELITGKTDFDLPWPRAAAERFHADDLQVIATGLARERVVDCLRTAEGVELTVEITRVPLHDEAQRVCGIVGAIEDITARLETQKRVAHQLRFEELVARISARLVVAQPDTLTDILSGAMSDIAALLDADRVVLGRTEEATGQMIDRAHFRLSDPPFPARLNISERYPSLWRRMRNGEVWNVRDAAALPDADGVDRAHFQEVDIRSQITVPVRVEGRLKYLLAVATVGRSATWTDAAVARAQVLADLLATTAVRCESEEAVRASERQFRTFIEQAPVPIILTPSPDGTALYCNPAFTRIFGYTALDMPTPGDWWSLIFPDPDYRAQRYAAWQSTIESVRKTGVFQDADEGEMRTKSGEPRYCQVRLSLADGYRMTFINDLTDRRQTENALRLTQYAVDHNPIMIFRIDMEGRFVYANDAACRQFGCTPAEMLRHHVWDVSTTITTREIWPQRAAHFREEGLAMYESWYTKLDGTRFPAEVRVQYVEFGGERLFVVFALDITRRRAAQEAEHAYTLRIQSLAAELTRAEERQRRELATVLHDGVGQNLFAAATQLLAIRARAPAALPEVDKVLALLDQITHDTRELTFELCPPVLYQLGLMAALQRLADQFSERYQILCSVSGQTAGPADLNLRGLAYQTVRELLNNIAKHAAARHVTIAAQDVDGAVRIEVADDGVGFDVQLLQAGGSGGKTGGFGLFHLRERIELLGGKLAIDTTPKKGCLIQFTLPLHALQSGE